MRFEAKPENDFEQFIDTYFHRCREMCPKLRAIVGKWTFEDLIPGMSDFDTRLLFSDDVILGEWAEMSLAVGRVHTKLAKEFQKTRTRAILLPGQCLSGRRFRNRPVFTRWLSRCCCCSS